MPWTADVCSQAAFAQPKLVSSISLGQKLSEFKRNCLDTWLRSGRLTCSIHTGFRAITTPRFHTSYVLIVQANDNVDDDDDDDDDGTVNKCWRNT